MTRLGFPSWGIGSGDEVRLHLTGIDDSEGVVLQEETGVEYCEDVCACPLGNAK